MKKIYVIIGTLLLIGVANAFFWSNKSEEKAKEVASEKIETAEKNGC